MAHVLSLIGAKGGTLKTASVAALGHLTATTGARVVMVDGDPQADLTSRTGFGRVNDPLAAEPVRVRYEGQPDLELWLLRGGRSMEGADFEAMRAHIARAAQRADLVLVDTPPALGPVTTAALREASLVIVPAVPGRESLERLHDVLSIAEQQSPAPPVRVLITQAHLQSNLFLWMKDQLDTMYPGRRMSPVVPFEMAPAEAALFELPVTLSAPRSKGSLAYCQIAAEVIDYFRLGDRHARLSAAGGTR